MTALYISGILAALVVVALGAHYVRAWWVDRDATTAGALARKGELAARKAADEALAKAGRGVDEADARAAQVVDEAKRGSLEDWAAKHGAGKP